MTQSSLLTQRLATLKAMSNTTIYSDDKSSASLSLYITIFNKARAECYIDNMEGAKALYLWLTSGDTIPLALPVTSANIPRLLYTYELGQLAKIISKEAFGPQNTVATNAIYHLLIKDTM